MSSSFRSCLAACSFLILTLFAAHPAKADTYQITVVDMTQNENFLGIDDQGDFVVNDSNNASKCGESFGDPCFEVFLVGQSPFFTATPPVLAFDNGSPCTIALDASFAPQLTASGICNNGHEIFGAFSNTLGFGVWDGPDTSDKILIGTFDGGFINANGDAVFIDGLVDELIFAEDLTTTIPEPSSLLLFGTGCLTMVGAFRRYIGQK